MGIASEKSSSLAAAVMGVPPASTLFVPMGTKLKTGAPGTPVAVLSTYR
jgi:hypothetical protein